MELNWVALTVFILLFGFITWLGFAAAHWRRGDLDQLHEWGLGGRRFGTFITWFLLGGDIYAAYTFIAVPALAFGAGALAFFAVPLHRHHLSDSLHRISATMVCIPQARLRHGGRFRPRALRQSLACTRHHHHRYRGDYAVYRAATRRPSGSDRRHGRHREGFAGDIPLIIAFVILAAFTYSSGLRAPASIAVVKDLLIYVTAFAAAIIIPIQLGGFGKIFAAVPPDKLLLAVPHGQTTGAYGTYTTFALGSAFALLLYPHTMTAILSATSGHTVRRNAALLPAYTFVLGLLALLGFFALADGVDKLPEFAEGFRQYKNNFAVPALFLHNFPSWFVGVAFAAIGIGALVPAAIMSIAAANLFTRNVYREFFRAHATGKQEAQMAKLDSLIVKFGALIFILFVPLQHAIQLQLLGGIWIIQTLPAVLIGLYTRRLNAWALLIGWAAGTFAGTYMAASVNFAATYPLAIAGWTFPGYIALYTLILNLVIAILLTPVMNMLGSKSEDQTAPADYYA